MFEIASLALSPMAGSILPPELLIQVFRELKDAPSILVRAALACHLFRDFVEPVLYEAVALRDQRRIVMFITTLLARPELGNFVRSLDLDWSLSNEEESEAQAAYSSFHTAGGPFYVHPLEREMDEAGDMWRSGDPPNASPVAAAEARGMSPGIRFAIRSKTAAAQVVLLLDMLPNLRSLFARPSRVDFWFFGAFPSPSEPADKRLPAGLVSLESLEVHYGDDDPDAIQWRSSHMNAGEGYAHIKLICALLLPNLRKLVLTGDEGREVTWGLYYDDDDEGEILDMDRLVGLSAVTDIEVRNTYMPTSLLLKILRMARSLERLRFEQYENLDFAQLTEILRNPCMRSVALVEYDLSDVDRDPKSSPFRAIGDLRNLTHLELPIQALVAGVEHDLARAVPVSTEDLDVCFGSPESLVQYTPAIARFLSQGHCPQLRRLTVRPDYDAAHAGVREACAASKVEFRGEHYVDPPVSAFVDFGGSDFDADYDGYDGYDDYEHEEDGELDGELDGYYYDGIHEDEEGDPDVFPGFIRARDMKFDDTG